MNRELCRYIRLVDGEHIISELVSEKVNAAGFIYLKNPLCVSVGVIDEPVIDSQRWLPYAKNHLAIPLLLNCCMTIIEPITNLVDHYCSTLNLIQNNIDTTLTSKAFLN